MSRCVTQAEADHDPRRHTAALRRNRGHRRKNSGNREFSRSRRLTLPAMLRLLVGTEGGSLASVLRAAGIEVSPAALSMRRGQIVPEIFQELFNRFNAACTDTATFRGYKVLACDGTAVNKPRNPDEPSFITHAGAPEGYNQPHLNPLYNILDRTFTDAVVQVAPSKDEIGALAEMMQRNNFNQKTVIIMHRGYESYNLMAHCIEKPNLDFVLRVKQNHSAMRKIARLPMFESDCDIAFTVTTTQTNEDKERGYIHLHVPKKSKPASKTNRTRWDHRRPYSMRLRICRFQLDNGTFETIATSLPRSFTLQNIKELYYMRWGIETSFRDLKYSIGLVNLHGKSDAYANQEIWAALTAFNATSRIVREAVAIVKEAIRNPGGRYSDLERQIGKNMVAVQPGRQDQRNLLAKGWVGFLYRVAA